MGTSICRKSCRVFHSYPGAVTGCKNISVILLNEQGRTIIRNATIFSTTYTGLMLYSASTLVTARNKQTMQKSHEVRHLMFS